MEIQQQPEEIGRIRRLVSRLSRRSAVRQCAERLLEEGPQPIEDVQPLLSALTRRGGRRKEREVAAWIFGQAQLTPEQRSMCAATLARVLEKRLKPGDARFIGRWACRTILVGALLTYFLLYSGFPFEETPPPWAYVLAFLCFAGVLSLFLSPFVLPASLAIDYYRGTRLRTLVTALGNLGAPGSLGTLALACLSTPLGKEAAQGLRHVVGQLTREHYGQLGSQTVPSLCRLLHHPNQRIILDALEALGKVGDGRAVLPVEGLLDPLFRPRAVGTSAQRILPILQERQRLENTSATLLRASTVPEPSPDVLLRPAAETSDVASEELLRAGTSE